MGNRRRSLLIQWLHLELDGAVCDRCSATGRALHDAMERMKRDLNFADVEIAFEETVLPKEEIPRSNAVILNGMTLESLLPGASITMTDCVSCCRLIGQDVQCRAVVLDGAVHEDIPPGVIHAAALAALERRPRRPDFEKQQESVPPRPIKSFPQE